MERFIDSFSLHREGQGLVARLQLLDAFAHTRQARIVVIGSQTAPRLHGHPCVAWIGEARVQGPCKWLFDWLVAQFVSPLTTGHDPDFLIMLDAAVWTSLDPDRQERLIYHELSHLQVRESEDGDQRLDEEGRPQLCTVPHDVEIFHSEVVRYGADIVGITDLCTAIVDGEARQRAKRKRRA